MVNFKERTAPATKVEVIPTRVPYVLIDKIALQKMFTYTDQCADEIGWLGTATRTDNEIRITDVFLFGQEVHGTTTEITPEGLEEFANELLQLPNGIDTWNNMKVWGHSHVNMGLTPSAQDNAQMNDFMSVGHDWFIRLICNKKGELCIDVYEYSTGLIFTNVAWERTLTEEEHSITEAMFQLQAKLDELSKGGLEELTPVIKQEMTAKVKKKVYARPTTTTTSTYTSSTRDFASSIGRYRGQKWRTWKEEAPTQGEMLKHSTLIPKYIRDEYKKENPEFKEFTERFAMLHDDNDAYKFLDPIELEVLSLADDIYELEEDLADYQYENQFVRADLEIILKEAKSMLPKAPGYDNITLWEDTYYGHGYGY